MFSINGSDAVMEPSLTELVRNFSPWLRCHRARHTFFHVDGHYSSTCIMNNFTDSVSVHFKPIGERHIAILSGKVSECDSQS